LIKNEELQNGDVIVTQTALPKKKIKKKDTKVTKKATLFTFISNGINLKHL